MAKAPKRQNRRLSQSEKISKRLRGIKSGVGLDVKKAAHTVNVYASRVPVTLNGFLVSIDKTAVVFRHKKTNGSKKTRISTFQRDDIIKVFGRAGEPSSITIINRALLQTLTGFISRDADTGAITVKDSVTGEVTVVFPSDFIQVEVYADEDEKEQRKAAGRKGRGKIAPDPEEDEDLDDEDDEDEDEDEDLDEDEDSEEDDDEDEDEDDEDEDDEDEDDEDLDDEDL